MGGFGKFVFVLSQEADQYYPFSKLGHAVIYRVQYLVFKLIAQLAKLGKHSIKKPSLVHAEKPHYIFVYKCLGS